MADKFVLKQDPLSFIRNQHIENVNLMIFCRHSLYSLKVLIYQNKILPGLKRSKDTAVGLISGQHTLQPFVFYFVNNNFLLQMSWVTVNTRNVQHVWAVNLLDFSHIQCSRWVKVFILRYKVTTRLLQKVISNQL